MITNEQASTRLIQFANEGRLITGKFHGAGADGREVACLLGSFDPSVEQASDCNADLMPLWMAETTVVLFDKLPTDAITPIGLRYGGLVARWHTVKPAQWDTILTKFLIRCVDDALEAARPVSEGKDYWPAVEAACKQTVAALQSGEQKVLKAAAANAADAYDAAYAYANALFTFLLDQIEAECVIAESAP